MKLRIMGAVAVAAMMSACGSKTTNEPAIDYSLNVAVDDSTAVNTMAYVLNYDNGEKIDSAVVEEGGVTFTGQIDAPTVVRLIVNGKRAGLFILDQDVTEVVTKKPNGALNAAYEALMNDYYTKGDSIRKSIPEDLTRAELDSVLVIKRQETADVLDNAILANIDNVLGYRMLADQGVYMKADRFKKFIDANPALLDYKRIATLQKSFDAVAATSAGKPYVDFSVEYDGVTTSLSDYVKPGEYTLVDFWASWCGPCKHEINNYIKGLYEKYNGKGLNIVGVTVWDKPEDTVAYLEENPLPWTIMLNAQAVPSELYGFNGIPCIILIGPDGTIVGRDLREQGLVDAVDAAMTPAE